MQRAIRSTWSPIRVIRERLNVLGAATWVTGSFAIGQVLRLVTSVVLARLLAPDLLGTMVLINSLRTGGELLSDLGIGQSVVKSPQGENPDFYSTAWTIQVLRGIGLFVIGLLSTIPLSFVYGRSQLLWLIPIVSLVFVVNSFVSPATYILQKRLDLRKQSIFGTLTNLCSSALHIALALLTRTIWALVGGLLLSSVVNVIGSFFLIKTPGLRFKVDKSSYQSIVHFGKWIFASSIIYFLASNFDRLYFAKAVPLAVLGVYGIARTLADAINLLMQRLGTSVVFPKISSANLSTVELRRKILPLRRMALLFLAIGLACAVALADRFIFLAYDTRYRAAAVFLPLMLVGTWFSTLGSFADAMLMGIGKPANVAYANAAKFLAVIVAVPIALGQGGVVLAVCVFAVAEVVRYAVLVFQKRASGLAFSRQDLWMTASFFVLTFACREVFYLLGLTGSVSSWVSSLRALLA